MCLIPEFAHEGRKEHVISTLKIIPWRYVRTLDPNLLSCRQSYATSVVMAFMFKSKITLKGRLRKGEEAENEFNDDAENESGCYRLYLLSHTRSDLQGGF